MQFFDFFFEEAIPIGFPTSSGVGNAIRFDTSFSISLSSKNPDIAWSFIQQFYKPDFYIDNPSLIPINVDALDIWYTKKDLSFTLGLGDYTLEFKEATDYDRERMREIIESVTRISRLDKDIFALISEEADAYFRDVRSAEDAARIFQNRVQTLVWEQSD